MNPRFPVFDDIAAQPRAIDQVLAYQLGPGRAELERAARLIRRGERLVIGAIGASYAACIPCCYRLAAAGRPVALHDAAELLHYGGEAYGPGTVYVLVSRSGDTIEIVRLTEALRAKGQTIIGVTNVAGSKLANASDACLLLGSPADYIIAVQTYGATVLALLLLAETLLGGLDESPYREQLTRLSGSAATALDFANKALPDQAAAFPATAPAYLLARGASQASAHEASLIFHEMARHAATAPGAGYFRHGPWEVVDGDFQGFVFAADDRTYELNIALARDIARLGGQVRLITPRPPSGLGERIDIWPVERLDPYLAPMVEIIPMQVFIHAFAAAQGLVPGQFRASLPITLAETGSKADD